MWRLAVILGIACILILFLILRAPSGRVFECYIINLKRNHERLQHITNIYSKSDLNTEPYILVEAIDGSSINPKEYVTEEIYDGITFLDKFKKRVDDAQLTRGMIGCYLSHLKVFDLIKTSGKPYGMILEDDATFPEDIFTTKINDALNAVPSDWDIILLGRWPREEKRLKNYVKVERFFGTHGYLINQKGIEKMQKFGSYPIEDQIDGVMGTLARTGVLNIYAPHENIIYVNTSLNSDVQMAVQK